MRYRLDVAYRGTRFHGSTQTRLDTPSVMGALQRAATSLLGGGRGGYLGDVQHASRTDAGVHALQNVAHLDIMRPPGRPAFAADALRDSLNARLDGDAAARGELAVLAAAAVGDDWHCRRHVAFKTYTFRLMCPLSSSSSSSPLLTAQPLFARPHSLWMGRPLDVAAMRAAAAQLVGTHDFSSLRASGCVSDDATKTLYQVSVFSEADGGGDGSALAPYPVWRRALPWLPEVTDRGCHSAPLAHVRPAVPCDYFDGIGPSSAAARSGGSGGTDSISIILRGDAFLYKMCRNVVGLLLEVGLRRLPADAIGALLQLRDRGQLPRIRCAAPHGLWLCEVAYEDEVGARGGGTQQAQLQAVQ